MKYLFTFDLRRGGRHMPEIINQIATEEAAALNFPQELINNLIQRVNNRIEQEYGEIELDRNYNEIEIALRTVATDNGLRLLPIRLNTSYLIESDQHTYEQIYQIINNGLLVTRIILPTDDYVLTELPNGNHIIHRQINER